MTELVINLPLPPKACHPNHRSRSHWPRVRGLKQARETAAFCALEALYGRDAPRWSKATLAAHWTFKLTRHRGSGHDTDGLQAWLKGSQDGLQDARIVANDNGITPLPPTWEYDNSKPEGVTLRITPLPGPGLGEA